MELIYELKCKNENKKFKSNIALFPIQSIYLKHEYPPGMWQEGRRLPKKLPSSNLQTQHQLE